MRGIIDRKLVEGQLTAYADGPLIGLLEHRHLANGRPRKVGEAAGDIEAFLIPNPGELFAGVRKDRRVVSSAGRHAIRRPAHHHQQTQTSAPSPHPGATHSLDRGNPDTTEVNCRHPLEANGGRQARHLTRVDHPDARQKPHQKQQTERDAHPAVDQNHPSSKPSQDASHRGGLSVAPIPNSN
jgi:hypothetical protein